MSTSSSAVRSGSEFSRVMLVFPLEWHPQRGATPYSVPGSLEENLASDPIDNDEVARLLRMGRLRRSLFRDGRSGFAGLPEGSVQLPNDSRVIRASNVNKVDISVRFELWMGSTKRIKLPCLQKPCLQHTGPRRVRAYSEGQLNSILSRNTHLHIGPRLKRAVNNSRAVSRMSRVAIS